MSKNRLRRYGLCEIAIPSTSIDAVKERIAGMMEYRLRQFSSIDKAIELAMIDAYSQGLIDGVKISDKKKAA